ncbi:unnamed protein product [Rotaria socialis]|uniref:Uncharacterized protein n=1 Tax=Rotaria socialis TaxID=392032 RepID=A0A817VB40_9BILA|nr:unnamed protein product [Rotaria socialis]CAF4775394.1 unnamed protein product [Rotaria socialis]
MFHQCIILIVGLVTLMYVSATNASGLCSCSCCDGDQCDPVYEGTAIASTCAQSNCVAACKTKFEDACGRFLLLFVSLVKRQVQQSCRLQQRARRLMGSVHVRVVMVISVIRYMKALQLPHHVLNLIV